MQLNGGGGGWTPPLDPKEQMMKKRQNQHNRLQYIKRRCEKSVTPLDIRECCHDVEYNNDKWHFDLAGLAYGGVNIYLHTIISVYG